MLVAHVTGERLISYSELRKERPSNLQAQTEGRGRIEEGTYVTGKTLEVCRISSQQRPLHDQSYNMEHLSENVRVEAEDLQS